MTWYQQKRYPENGFFYENMIHFLHCLHLPPLKEYSKKFLPSNELKLIELSTTHGEYLTINFDELPSPDDNDFIHLSACIFINSCFEKIKENNLYKKDPVFEFLRHVRNAASHNCKFIFKDGEPKKTATWRNLTITKELNNTKLFEFIMIGDLISLIQDIEKYLKDNKWEEGLKLTY